MTKTVFGVALLAAMHVSARSAAAATVHIAAGGDLQTALVNARPGDVIELEAGAVFTGNYTLPRKEDSPNLIVLKSAAAGGVALGRITPANAAPWAKLVSPNDLPALQTAPGAHHWRIELLEISGRGTADLLALGSSSQSALSSVPHDIVVDRCYIHGDATVGVRRCVALNSASTIVSNSYISDCKSANDDAQAIAGWNGPGPFGILNNYLEGSGENVLFGGADPAISNLVPADITIRGNLIAKPVSWRAEPWQVKNLLELKNARRVAIQSNTIENNWEAAQSGFAVLFTVRNQDGHCPWCQVEQVDFTGNTLRHVAAGIEILGVDDSAPSRQTRTITIRENFLSDIDPGTWGGSGYALLLLGGPRDIVIDHNTIIQDNASGILQVEGPPILGFVMTNNVARQGQYGVIGTDHAPGNDTISAFFPAAQVTHNVIAGADSQQYPSGNFFPSDAQFRAQFASFDTGNFQLASQSSWRRAGTDGLDLGATAAPAKPTPPRDPRQDAAAAGANLGRPLGARSRAKGQSRVRKGMSLMALGVGLAAVAVFGIAGFWDRRRGSRS
jgi:hypothetical protein